MIDFIVNILKGVLMGAANVIPGVSGGTMALLTGIFEKLIHTVKSFDLKTFELAFSFKYSALCKRIDFKFLSSISVGIGIGILAFSRILKYLFAYHELYVWAFFFGLILASVYFVGKKIRGWNISIVILFALGAAAATGLSFMEPAKEHASIPYLFVCGAAAMCSMILPGLSGSYVLLLMGNYQLVMIEAVSELDLGILLPVGIGAIAGLALFARFLSWMFKQFHDQTLALLTGFIFGSLSILWPWKEAIIKNFGEGAGIKEKAVGYNYTLPELNAETGAALVIMAGGILIIIFIEALAGKAKTTPAS